jgi:hypothetical protein
MNASNEELVTVTGTAEFSEPFWYAGEKFSAIATVGVLVSWSMIRRPAPDSLYTS